MLKGGNSVTYEEMLSAFDTLAIAWPIAEEWKDKSKAEYKAMHLAFGRRCEDFCERVRRADGSTTFGMLFPLACSSRLGLPGEAQDWKHFGRPSLAAHLLFYLKPPCPLSCTDALRFVAGSSWDVSLEEVAWYLAVCFGNDTMHRCLNEMEATDDIQKERAVRAAWHDSNSHRTTFADLKEIWQETPPGEMISGLDTLRYWLNIFVSRQEDILKEWRPFWQDYGAAD